MTARFESKILSRGDCVAAVAGRYARPLVFTNGVFDILHRGHATYLDQAAQLGGTLIVAVNTDESVRRLGRAPSARSTAWRTAPRCWRRWAASPW